MKKRVFPFKSQPKRAIASLDLARSRRELISFEDAARDYELAVHVVQVETQDVSENISAAEGASYVDVLPQIGERAPGGLEAQFWHLSGSNMTEYVLDKSDISSDLQRRVTDWRNFEILSNQFQT